MKFSRTPGKFNSLYYLAKSWETVEVMLLFVVCIILVPFDAVYKLAVARLYDKGWL